MDELLRCEIWPLLLILFKFVAHHAPLDQAFHMNQQYGLAVVGDSADEQGRIYNAIVQVSKESKVDARLILAVIMQEVRLTIFLARTCDLLDSHSLGSL